MSDLIDDNAVPVVTDAPAVIWLCYGDVFETQSHAALERDGVEVTWCQDKQDVSDVRYVRADTAAERIAELESALETERMRLAACSTAALGYYKDGDAIKEEYESASLSDVCRLYQEAARLRVDGERLDYLQDKLFCADFEYPDGENSKTSALVFKWPKAARISANLRSTIDAAKEQS